MSDELPFCVRNENNKSFQPTHVSITPLKLSSMLFKTQPNQTLAKIVIPGSEWFTNMKSLATYRTVEAVFFEKNLNLLSDNQPLHATLVSGDKNKQKCPPIRTRTSFGKLNMSADKNKDEFWEIEDVRR